ncbi:NUDIX hydrolase [Mycolicibacterium llatzerense]|uniref:NUDIX hydrolase n=1 Tax=Mycolicibacterium llatzerense TaxID=280871 RepID=UPI0008DD1601|nr:NUDIX hydrolase [Mycolicibacterium llatzerense]
MEHATHMDADGNTLADYPRPSVAVDTAVLTLDPDLGLAVLQVRRSSGPGWALPGRILRERETLAAAVEISLTKKANVCGLRPRQLHVFDDPDRDERGWVLSVAHVAVVPVNRVADRFPATTRLMPVESPGRLPYGHENIIDRAVADLRARYLDRPDPDLLLGAEFTLRELRQAHDIVRGHRWQPDNFRRAMLPHLIETNTRVSVGRGRPAEVFRRRERDPAEG